MKKAMILGAGRGQIPIMNICHDYGWYVLAISPEGNYPGLNVADKVCYLDVKNKEVVLEVAKKEKIQAVLTDQLDAGVQTAAYVAEKMGLPGITSEVALKFTNKYIMRQEAKKIGVNVPYAVSVFKLEDALTLLNNDPQLKFPLMMKPVDNAASKGVYKVKCIDDVIKKFESSKRYSGSGEVIMERFIEGREYVVEAFTRDYEVKNLVVGHRDYFQIPDTFIPNATVFIDADSANSDLEKRLKAINKALVTGYGLKFGITHGEYIYNENEDRIYLVEIAARGGGVFISSDLIPGASGVNANDLLVREALGINERHDIKIEKGASAYFCYLTPRGTVTALNGVNEVEQINGVIRAFFDNIGIGTVSNSITDKSSRKGPILVRGESKAKCYDIIEQVKKTLDIKITDNGQDHNVIWHDITN